MAAAVAAGNSVAGVFAWKTRAGRGADLFIHSNPSSNRKTERGARGKNSDDAAAGFTRDLRRCACADRKSTRLNSSHRCISYAVFCLKKKSTIHGDRYR